MRADVMREVGIVLHNEKLSVNDTAEIRANLAEALSKSPSRVQNVIVVNHVGISDMSWNETQEIYMPMYYLNKQRQQVIA